MSDAIREGTTPLPDPDRPLNELEQQGKVVFERACAQCHGGPGQSTSQPPAPPFGQPRPQAVVERVAYAVKKIRAAGRVAGTLVTSDEAPSWLEHGVRYFYIHSDPFLRVGLASVRKMLGR